MDGETLWTRFAPSPTGFLHLGHAAHMVYVWGMAQARGARVLLRIEDHDRTRCTPAFEAALLEDLDWLGLRPDRPAADVFRQGVSDCRQSDCGGVYRAALEGLAARGLVYACTCSRKDLAARVGAHAGETPYDGHCRDRGIALDTPGVVLRVRLPDAEAAFDDLLIGAQRQRPAMQCGDVAARDRHGCWTYQFAVTVDDGRHGIGLIVRGRDLLESTGRQLVLARLLGRDAMPVFAHHPLIADAQGVKLSKRDFARPLRALRAEGLSGAQALGLAAYRVGLTARPEPLAPEALGALLRG